MEFTVWELRFVDGRGASFFTDVDVTEDVGRVGVTRVIPVATDVLQESALGDARRSIEAKKVINLAAHMGAIAYALEHGSSEEP